MTRARDFDYSPLTRRAGLGRRISTARTNNLMVIGGTVGVLLVVASLAVFIGLVATGNASDIGGLAVLALCFGGGAYAVLDVLRKSGEADALGNFARANGLTLLRGSTAPDYAGSLFTDESHAVYHSVRTQGSAFVEVGERFPTTTPRRSDEPNRPELFVRARLASSARRGAHPGELVSRALDDALEDFAGSYSIEVSGDELTLFGSRGLDIEKRGRVEEAFALADELVAIANARIVPSARPRDIEGETGAETGVEAPARSRGPLTVIGWTLALVIGGPIVIAIIMAILDDGLRGDVLVARIVVSLVIVAALAVVARLVRASLTRRRAGERRSEPR